MGTERSGSGSDSIKSNPPQNDGRKSWRHQPWELRQMQSLPLKAKKRMTADRIKGWYETFGENVYFSYSGGKDSTVLLEMVAKFCEEYGYKLFIVFCDTGLEYVAAKQSRLRNGVRV